MQFKLLRNHARLHSATPEEKPDIIKQFAAPLSPLQNPV
jgi:hypothetical protein